MTLKTRSPIRIVLIAVLALFFPLKVEALGPLEQLRQTADKALQILNDPKLLSQDKKNERADRLLEIVRPVIDFEEMAKRSLNSHWQRQTPSKQQEFARLFQQFLEKIYTSKFPLYDGETIVFAGESTKGNYAWVHGDVVSKKGEKPTSVVFKLRQLAGQWKIYDVVVKEISMVDNYRAQFDRVIQKSSYEELIVKIKNRTGSPGDS